MQSPKRRIRAVEIILRVRRAPRSDWLKTSVHMQGERQSRVLDAVVLGSDRRHDGREDEVETHHFVGALPQVMPRPLANRGGGAESHAGTRRKTASDETVAARSANQSSTSPRQA
jgi:hypothetical protein